MTDLEFFNDVISVLGCQPIPNRIRFEEVGELILGVGSSGEKFELKKAHTVGYVGGAPPIREGTPLRANALACEPFLATSPPNPPLGW